MPVHRYRAIEDVSPPPSLDPRDPATAGKALDHVEAMTAGLPPLFAAGVYRYGSIEAAGADRERALLARMRRLWATRRRLWATRRRLWAMRRRLRAARGGDRR